MNDEEKQPMKHSKKSKGHLNTTMEGSDIKMIMYRRDHEPPHVHAVRGKAERIIGIVDGKEIIPSCPAAKEAVPLPDMMLRVAFEGGTTKLYDVKPLMKEIEVFKKLKNNELFNRVKVNGRGYGLVWNDQIDLAIEEVWCDGETVESLLNELNQC
jgi:hypothetical protein